METAGRLRGQRLAALPVPGMGHRSVQSVRPVGDHSCQSHGRLDEAAHSDCRHIVHIKTPTLPIRVHCRVSQWPLLRRIPQRFSSVNRTTNLLQNDEVIGGPGTGWRPYEGYAATNIS